MSNPNPMHELTDAEVIKAYEAASEHFDEDAMVAALEEMKKRNLDF